MFYVSSIEFVMIGVKWTWNLFQDFHYKIESCASNQACTCTTNWNYTVDWGYHENGVCACVCVSVCLSVCVCVHSSVCAWMHMHHECVHVHTGMHRAGKHPCEQHVYRFTTLLHQYFHLSSQNCFIQCIVTNISIFTPSTLSFRAKNNSRG